jgi:hypothetical protein
MMKVWIINSNGSNREETFVGAEEAINYAKECSLRSLCTFRTEGKNIVAYEYGEQVTDKERVKELFVITEAIENQKNERYAKEGRGKACKRKV